MTALDDFSGSNFGDKRLGRRLLQIVAGLAPNPAASLPDAAKNDVELEGTYRFLGNEKVTPERILAPHYAATVDRARAVGLVLCAHDTTEFSFSTHREGMGRINDSGRGFFAHVALALRADEARSPLGVLGLLTHVRRTAPRKHRHTENIPPEQRESYRWRRSIDEVEGRLEGHADVVHLLDSEADAYLLLEHMVGTGSRFVVRATHKRTVTDEGGDRQPLADALTLLEGVFERRVPLSARVAPSRKSRKRNVARDPRLAHLAFSATRVTLHRPHGEKAETKSLSVNVVHVRELNALEGAEPVDWMLYTTEPIATGTDIERIVDFYRARWRIEELFKALKTGCAFEKRQLESMATLLNALAVFLPIACDLLALRALASAEPERPAREVLPTIVLRLLQFHPRSKLPVDASIHDAMLAVARFGGHIRNNGAPGWLVLGRGYEEVLILAEGMAIGLKTR